VKLTKITLNRFKRFRNFELDLSLPPGLPNIVLLVGDNGAGKSTILQAIAAALGTATGQLAGPTDLKWPGFVPESLSASHRGFAEAVLKVEFTEDELTATRQYYERSDYATGENATAPADTPSVTLRWNTDPDAKYPVSTIPAGARYFFQFQGRRYAYNLLYNRSAESDMFRRIGGVFWYTEQRTAYSLAPFLPEGAGRNGKAPITQIDSEESMRALFTRWYAFHQRQSNDKLARFNEIYSRLFPGRKFSRIVDTYGAATPPVYFYDGSYEYDISELSGGERALMPLLLDFVEWGIHNSVILIDELELHLHPPLQQALLTLLPSLGHNNQFIITTHSDSVASLALPDAIKRIGLHERSH
jgi:predicted ATPase